METKLFNKLPSPLADEETNCDILKQVWRIAERTNLKDLDRGSRGLPADDLDCPLAGVRLVGRLDGIWDTGRVQVRFSKLEGSWELEEWIRHLAFCAAGPEGGEPATHVIGRPASKEIMQLRFSFVENAREELEQLIAIYFRGQRVAMPFFPKTSRKYLTTLVNSKSPDAAEKQASQNAYKFWRPESNESNPAQPGTSAEVEDPYFSRVFGNQDPLALSWYPVEGEEGDGFRSLARRVYGPLLNHREEIIG